MNPLPLTFLFPWALAALPLLAVLWWIIRRNPPRPARHVFPALRILRDLLPRQRRRETTPPWLLILRLLIAFLAILSAARPIWRPQTPESAAPALIVIANDWSSAANWPRWAQDLDILSARILRRGQALSILSLDDRPPYTRLVPVADTGAMKKLVRSLRPYPWPADYRALANAVVDWQRATKESGPILWFSGGIGDEPAAMNSFYSRLAKADNARMIIPAGRRPLLLTAAIEDGRPQARLQSPVPVPLAESHTIIASSDDGITLATTELRIEAGETEGRTTIDLPRPLAARIARLSVAGREEAASTVLIGNDWRYPVIGLAGESGGGQAAPLLDPRYYLKRALAGLGVLSEGDPADLAAQGASVIILPDATPLSATQQQKLQKWVGGGGTLIRFPGKRPFASDDPLLPVPLRKGERRLDGALNWIRPQGLSPFPPRSPFFGLPAEKDVRILRQVLAQPSPDLEDATWATLTDGTPLVTARRIGQGTVVLFHVTANSDWSNLPQSGLFIGMLESLTGLGEAMSERRAGNAPPLPARRLLDGFGRLIPAPVPPPLLPAVTEQRHIGPALPPGLYGTKERRTAFNLAGNLPRQYRLIPPSGIAAGPLDGTAEVDLTPWLVTLALLLAAIDALLLTMFFPRRGPTAAMLLALLLADGIPPAQAQESTAVPPAALETRFAYIITGDAERDGLSKAGLQGLSRVVAQRSSIEPGPPEGIDPARDELIFYPFIYWPFGADQPEIGQKAADNLRAYMGLGGTILIDTADAAGPLSVRRRETDRALRRLLRRLRAPTLRPLPGDHVLLRSFYLLRSLPGRWNAPSLWIGDDRTNENDGVAALIIGRNDWAAAWATDAAGLPVAAVDGGPRQREMAFRFGINLAAYALTGNYKADQVHIPAILERLGQ